MSLSRVALIGVLFVAVASSGFAGSTTDWEQYSDKQLRVTFRHPKEWRTDPAYYDRTYFGGRDGHVQLLASGEDTAQQGCEDAANHHLQPCGSHPRIRPLKINGQKACLVWPSDDGQEGPNADAALFVEFPQSIEINGISYNLLALYADKKHILEIMKTLRFS